MSEVLSDTLRDALHSDVLAAYDYTESVLSGLRRGTPEQVQMNPATYASITRMVDTAFRLLFAVRVLTDWRRERDD